MIRFLGIEIEPRTWGKTWALTLANSGRGFVDTFASPRLWVGLGISISIHGLIFLLGSGIFQPKAAASDEDYDLTSVTQMDESLPPKAQKLIQQEPQPYFSSTQESEVIDLETRRSMTQAQIRSDEEFDLSMGSTVSSGDVIRINTDAALSTKDLLNEATISLKKGTHAYGGSRFEAISSGGGPSIDIKTAGKTIGESEVIKTVESQGTQVDVSKASTGAGASFAIEGDLSSADIVRKSLPQYPSWAKAKGFSKVTIRVSFTVDASGSVQPTMVVRSSSGYTQWDNQVQTALRDWKFKPAEVAKRNGIITFVFQLQ